MQHIKSIDAQQPPQSATLKTACHQHYHQSSINQSSPLRNE